MKSKVAGIYAITNLSTGTTYIGASTHILYKWQSDRKRLKEGRFINDSLQSDYNKLGANNFKFKIIQIVYTDISELDWHQLKQKWMNNTENLYNTPIPASTYKLKQEKLKRSDKVIRINHIRDNQLSLF